MPPSDSSAIARALGQALGTSLEPRPVAPVHGGSINECYRWESGAGSLFVKVAEARQLEMFEAEAAGLEELRAAAAVRVPRVLATGATENTAFLALEWIDFAPAGREAQAMLGEQLACQHRTTAREFGWHKANTIGSTPQTNEPATSWVEFFRERRLRYQLDLARRNGYRGPLQEEGAALLERIDDFFQDHHPEPSLLHGDLWGGNWAADLRRAPVLFDPAVYFGDREADIAMTRLFGGFGPAFYAAYEAAWPLARGAAARVRLYNLYHVLNHLNLFGAGYLPQAREMISRLLAGP